MAANAAGIAKEQIKVTTINLVEIRLVKNGAGAFVKGIIEKSIACAVHFV